MKQSKIHITFCHRLPHRSFFWKGKQFPVCARCTGIHLGYLSMPIFLFRLVDLSLVTALVMVAPTYIDGIRQHLTKRESTNVLRVTSGFVSGIGTMALVSMFGQYVGHGIKLWLETN